MRAGTIFPTSDRVPYLARIQWKLTLDMCMWLRILKNKLLGNCIIEIVCVELSNEIPGTSFDYICRALLFRVIKRSFQISSGRINFLSLDHWCTLLKSTWIYWAMPKNSWINKKIYSWKGKMIIIKMPVLSKLIFISNVIPIKILTGFIWFAWNINLFNLPEFIILKNNWAKTSLFFL